jgi:uncharacterized membrane protein
MTIEIFTWVMVAIGVAVIMFGLVMAIALNKLINAEVNCPEGTQSTKDGNFTRLKTKGEL